MTNNQVIIIKEGQLVTGRKQLAEQTGLKETTIERILDFFESEHQIGQQKTTKYRLITIVNWKEYQQTDNTLDNKRTTNGQQTDTNKNVKNIKNNKMISSSTKSLLEEDKENSDEIEINSNIDEDGNEITHDKWGRPLKKAAPKTPKNKEITTILINISNMIHKAINVYPVLDIVSYKQVSFARHSAGLTEKQIYSIIQDRIDSGLPDHEVVSIPRALSARQIEKYKIHAQIS